MAKELERDLGLYATITISVGAMLGSGIFVLPGLATKFAGPAVVAAYVLAGLLALPAALSKAEMATAIPEAGGTYLYIDRAMGPFMGTVAGIGVWFSLTFKSAFALVGLGAYLVLFAALPTKLVALGIGAALILLNVAGVKQTGTLQAILVTGVLAVLMWFIGSGVMSIEVGNFDGFFDKGVGGLLAATGFVFVSYAGVTKIASVAEEVENPDRNIPLGILGSIAGMMIVYALIVTVIVGLLEPGAIETSLTPMADAARAYLGTPGTVIIALTAVLALTGMANAGLLSSSRYPLAMSRDELAPDFLQRIHGRFGTPIAAITATGTLLLFLIATIPVVELAKLASAFKILVFIFINVALIAMREGKAEWYDPSFRSPLYPWVQILGVVGGVVLLTQMGPVPLVGAIVLILAGTAWYQFYARGRTTREGVSRDVVRRGVHALSLKETEAELTEGGTYQVLIAVNEEATTERLGTLLGLARDVTDGRDPNIRLLAFEEVPDQVSLDLAVRSTTAEDLAFEERAEQASEAMEVTVTVGEVVSHDRARALQNYVSRHDIDLVIAEADPEGRNPYVSWTFDGGGDRRVNTILLRPGSQPGWPRIRTVDVVAGQGPLDPVKVRLSNSIAEATGASIRFLLTVDGEVSDQEEASLLAYGEELAELTDVPTESRILRVDEVEDQLPQAVSEASLVVGSRRRGLGKGVEDLPSWMLEGIQAPVLVVDTGDRKASLGRRIFERIAY